MEKGTVINFNLQKGFGFIKRTGKADLFFHQTALSKGQTVEEGDLVQFEEKIDPNTQKPRAEKVQIVSRKHVQSKELKILTIKWTFGDPIILEEGIQMPIWLTFTRGNKPASGLVVTLVCNNVQEQYPAENPTTDGQGMVFFYTYLHRDTKLAVLVAQTENQAFTYGWELKKKTPHLSIVEMDTSQWKTFQITTSESENPDDPLVPATVEIWSANGAVLSVKKASAQGWQSGTRLEFQCEGRIGLLVRIQKLPKELAADQVYLAIKGTRQESGPYHLSRHFIVNAYLGGTSGRPPYVLRRRENG